MACEVPVISSNAGGLPELNLDGTSGFVCKVGDVEDMAKKAIHILDEANLSRFKEGALNRAKDFEVSNILPIYVNFYEQTMENVKKSISTIA